MDTMDGLSMDLERANLDKLRGVFPECFAEGKLDIDKLLGLCGEYIDNDFEKYRFEWKGKAECLRLAQKRSAGTLRPCPEDSVNWDATQNLYIEGDNLEVLKLLQTAYYRRVKMIYIDPPYNTGNDFVYADDFADPQLGLDISLLLAADVGEELVDIMNDSDAHYSLSSFRYLALSLLKPSSFVAPVITWSSASMLPSSFRLPSWPPAMMLAVSG